VGKSQGKRRHGKEITKGKQMVGEPMNPGRFSYLSVTWTKIDASVTVPVHATCSLRIYSKGHAVGTETF